MKAVLYNRGSSDKLEYCDVERPEPKDDEVLIRVHAVSPNAADYRSIKMGMIPKKKILGSGVAGKVASVGTNIQQFKPGDDVIGDLSDCGFGGFAEYAVAPEKAFVHKPDKITFEEASALPVASTTALQALQEKGKIQKGQTVLIVGSGGGVGTFTVQLAKYFGARITAVCSTRNIAQTTSLGAEFAIDYTIDDFIKDDKRYDLIIAINGNYPLLGYRKILERSGTYVMVGGALSQIFKSLLFGWLISFGSRKMKTLSAKSNRKNLEFMTKLVEEGFVKPVIERRYALSETAEAMSYLAEGHAGGKIVITIK